MAISMLVLIAVYGISLSVNGVKSRADLVYLYAICILSMPLVLLSSDFFLTFLFFEVSTLCLVSVVGIVFNANNIAIFPVLGRFYIFSLISSALFLFGCG